MKSRSAAVVVTALPAAPNLNLNVVPGRHLNADFILLVIRLVIYNNNGPLVSL